MSVDSLVARLRRRKLVGSFQVASETALLCRSVVSTYRWQHVDQLITHLKSVGRALTLAQPREYASGNIVRRVLKMIREVHADSIAGLLDDESDGKLTRTASTTNTQSLHHVSVDSSTAIHSAILNLLGKPDVSSTQTSPRISSSIESGANLRPAIIAGIQDLMDELSRVYKDVGPPSLQYIHTSEIILTHGSSKTVSAFLKHASEQRKFTVLVTESAPNDTTAARTMVEQLNACGINTILVPDAAVFALMARVNKVIIGTHAILQNGGLLAASGARQVTLAARIHATPVVVVTGVYKLTPVYPFDDEGLIELVSPELVLPFKEGAVGGVDVVNPYWDYIEPELLALYITNLGAHAPTTLHRVMSENYDTEDYVL